HEAVKASFHDGVKLPRAYRTCGLTTDFCDATELATCRMYRSAGQVWNGLAKNAREGLGSPVAIWFWTFVLLGNELMAWLILLIVWLPENPMESISYFACAMAIAMPWIVRFHAAWRFRQSW